MATPCDCSVCPDGTPKQWKVTLSGVTNGVCTQCASFNGDFILDRQAVPGCLWSYSIPGSPCGYPALSLAISKSGSTYRLSVFIGSNANWLLTSSTPLDCLATYTPTNTLSLGCNWPSTVTATPILPSLSDTDFDSCLPALQKGEPPGSIRQSILPPYAGTPLPACTPASGAAPGGTVPGFNLNLPGGTSAVSATRAAAADLAGGGLAGGCGTGTTPQFGSASLDAAMLRMQSWQSAVVPTLPAGLDAGPG